MSLVGKTILVGREPDRGRLLLSVDVKGNNKIVAIGNDHSVPNTVSRCRPNENRAHCRIEVLNDNDIRITNLNDANYTGVNGQSIRSAVKKRNVLLDLGGDNYSLNVAEALNTLEKIIDGGGGGEVSIIHLEKVWNDYEKVIDNIKRKQIQRGKVRMLPLVIGSLGTVVSMLFGQNIIVAVAIALISILIYIAMMMEKDTSIEDTKKADDKLLSDYRCPNPKCNHYLNKQPYKVIKDHGSCPYCKTKWK